MVLQTYVWSVAELHDVLLRKMVLQVCSLQLDEDLLLMDPRIPFPDLSLELTDLPQMLLLP